jgi:hypothetical protein
LGLVEHSLTGYFAHTGLIFLFAATWQFLAGTDWGLLEKDLPQGIKAVYWGQVYEWRRTSSRNTPKKYFLHLSPSLMFEVTREFYKRFKLGQKVEVHVAPLSRLVLVLELRPEGDS